MPKTKDEPIEAMLEIVASDAVIELNDHVDEVEPPVEPSKKDEPKPGEPAYDWAPHYGGTAEPVRLYTHTFPDGTVVSIRDFGSIYSKTWLYKLRKAQTDTDIQFAAIDRAACDTAQALIESIEAPLGGKDPIDELWEAWSKAGTSHVDGSEGLTTGE